MQLIGFANIFYFFSAGGKNSMEEFLISGGPCNRLKSLGLCDGQVGRHKVTANLYIMMIKSNLLTRFKLVMRQLYHYLLNMLNKIGNQKDCKCSFTILIQTLAKQQGSNLGCPDIDFRSGLCFWPYRWRYPNLHPPGG